LALGCTPQNDKATEKRKADLLRVKQAHPFRLPMFLPAQDTLAVFPDGRHALLLTVE